MRLRFAPSPTGILHIGGLRTALFNWLLARKNNGLMFLRIEDTDVERNLESSYTAITESLMWAGIDWDGEIIYQKDRLDKYMQACELLLDKGYAYKCYHTKESYDALKNTAVHKNPKYSNEYRNGATGSGDYVVRLKTPLEGSMEFNDLVYGPIVFDAMSINDEVIFRSDGMPLYNLAAAVDDHDMKISHIIRGADHIINTPIQMLIHKALNVYDYMPKFAHLPIILDLDGQKLSKRNKYKAPVDTAEYRALGYDPVGVINYIARLGWSHGDQEVFEIHDLVSKFSFDGIQRANGKFDPKKLDKINTRVIKTIITENEYVTRFNLHLVARLGYCPDAIRVERVARLVRGSAASYLTAVDMCLFMFEAPTTYEEVTDRDKELLTLVMARLNTYEDFSADAIYKGIRELLVEYNSVIQTLPTKEVMQAINLAISGKRSCFQNHEAMAFIGKTETIRRMKVICNE